MKWISNYKHPKGLNFEIEYDEFAGYYFYANEDETNIYDDLQDTLEVAKEVALEEFGVPIDSWKQVE